MTARAERLGELRRLALELRSDLAAMERLCSFAAGVVAPGSPVGDVEPRDQMALALTMHHIYTAIEQALLRVARVYDRTTYAGGDWQRDLPRNMATELPGVRPAVLDLDLVRKLDEYRGFRHVVRHAYDYSLDWDRMRPLLERLPATVAAVTQQMERFLEFVEACSDELSSPHPGE